MCPRSGPWGLAISDSSYEVFAVEYGLRTAAVSELYLNHHFYGEPDEEVPFGYFFWIARNAERTIVIDCGYSPAAAARRNRPMAITPVAALSLFGIQAASVDQLILSHGHYDHIGNVAEFGSAELVIARSELDFWTGPFGRRGQVGAYTEPDGIATILGAGDRLTLVEGQYSPAPGIEIIEVGGHTVGQTVIVISTATGSAVVASDAVHLFGEVELDRPFGSGLDVVGMYRVYDQLRELTSAPGSRLVAGHDHAVMNRFTACAGDLAGIAVQIG